MGLACPVHVRCYLLKVTATPRASKALTSQSKPSRLPALLSHPGFAVIAARLLRSDFAKSLQLHFLQTAEGTAKGKGQITLGIQLRQRYSRL